MDGSFWPIVPFARGQGMSATAA